MFCWVWGLLPPVREQFKFFSSAQLVKGNQAHGSLGAAWTFPWSEFLPYSETSFITRTYSRRQFSWALPMAISQNSSDDKHIHSNIEMAEKLFRLGFPIDLCFWTMSGQIPLYKSPNPMPSSRWDDKPSPGEVWQHTVRRRMRAEDQNT